MTVSLPTPENPPANGSLILAAKKPITLKHVPAFDFYVNVVDCPVSIEGITLGPSDQPKHGRFRYP